MRTYIFKIGDTRVFTIANRESFTCPKIGEHISFNQHEYRIEKVTHYFNEVSGRTTKTATVLGMELA